jgi:hypothetical protein
MSLKFKYEKKDQQGKSTLTQRNPLQYSIKAMKKIRGGHKEEQGGQILHMT